MNKIAQRRNILNKIREKVNAPGEAVSGMFSPEFTRLMDILREVDDEAREHAIDLKDMIKVARSNFNRREYMTSIAYLGKFHERLELVKAQFSKLNKEVDKVHNEFLFGDLDSEHKSYLFDKMPERYKPKPKIETKKAANAKDWWHNISSDRGRALKFWEKRFPKAAKEIKRQTEKMLSRSDMFLNVLNSTFKTLATLRATRRLEEYVKVAGIFSQKYEAYDSAFNEYFNGSVKKFIDSQRDFEVSKEMISEDIKNELSEGSPNTVVENSPPNMSSSIKNNDPTSIPEGEQTRSQVERELEEEIARKENGSDPVSFPKVETPSSIKPVITSDKFPALPAAEEEPSTNKEPEYFPKSRPILVNPSVDPFTQTMRSPGVINPPAIPKSDSETPNVYEQPIPPAARIPNMEELEKSPYADSRDIHSDANQSAPLTVTPLKQEFQSGPPTVRSVRTAEFIKNLTKLSDQNPLVMAKEIILFAKSIEATDKSASDSLLKIAKQLITQ